MTERFGTINAELPDTVADRPRFYAHAAARDRGFIRRLQWEALEHDDGEVVCDQERRTYVAARVAELAQHQQDGEIPADLDVAQLFLALQALASHPHAFPQMARHITGWDVDGPAFVRARDRFLEVLAQRLFG